MAKITNINGTSDTTCKCGSWLTHWKNFSGQSLPAYCPASSCLEKELVGAHVQKAYSSDKKWYIIPLCKKHNNIGSDKTIEISDTYNLVSANKKETCEKT